jgi:hypothetical protein
MVMVWILYNDHPLVEGLLILNVDAEGIVYLTGLCLLNAIIFINTRLIDSPSAVVVVDLCRDRLLLSCI